MPKIFLLILSIILSVSIAILALSTYGLGREEHDKSSSNYNAAFSFVMISLVSTLIAILTLIVTLFVSGPSSSVSPDISAILRR